MCTPNKDGELIASVKDFVKDYMSNYDASHDWSHIERVLHTAHLILKQEQTRRRPQDTTTADHPLQQQQQYDTTLVTLGSLLHDVGDKKYLLPGQDATTLVRDVLLARGATATLADTVQQLVLHVSFSTETKDPQRIRDTIAAIPELAIVQDADRLDAIGAVGIARCFTFGGARGRSGQGQGLQESVAHFVEKLERLEGMMKTDTGRALARERTERLKVFRGWWESESNVGLGQDE